MKVGYSSVHKQEQPYQRVIQPPRWVYLNPRDTSFRDSQLIREYANITSQAARIQLHHTPVQTANYGHSNLLNFTHQQETDKEP